jgi:hypothetical protein
LKLCIPSGNPAAVQHFQVAFPAAWLLLIAAFSSRQKNAKVLSSGKKVKRHHSQLFFLSKFWQDFQKKRSICMITLEARKNGVDFFSS